MNDLPDHIAKAGADVTALELKLVALMEGYKDIYAQGVSQATVLGLEAVCPDLITDKISLFTYTSTASDTNKAYALESLKNKILRTLVNILIKTIELFYKVVNWVVTRTARIAFTMLINKVDNKDTSVWEDISYSVRGDQSRKIIDTYADNCDSGVIGLLEDNSRVDISDERFYKTLNASMPIIEQALDEIESNVTRITKEDTVTVRELNASRKAINSKLAALASDASLIDLYDFIDKNTQTSYADIDTKRIKRSLNVKSDDVFNYDPQQFIVALNRSDKVKALGKLKRRGVPGLGTIERIAKTKGFEETSERERVTFNAHIKDVGERLANLLTQTLRIEERDLGIDPGDFNANVGLIQSSVNYLNKYVRSYNQCISIQEAFNLAKVDMVKAAIKARNSVKK